MSKIRKHTLFLCFILSLTTGCTVFKPSWVQSYGKPAEGATAKPPGDEITPEDFDGPLGGEFDDEGNWIPDKPEIATTYQIPDISAGFIFDIHTLAVSPTIQVELLEVNTHVPCLGTLKLDVGVAYQRAFVYVGKLWTNIFEISTGVWGGWNWDDNVPAYGVAFTIIKF